MPDSVLFKGRVLSLTVLSIQTADAQAIQAGLEQHVGKAPQLFAGLPVVIDPNGHAIALDAVAQACRQASLMPIAVLDPDKRLGEAATAAGLGTIGQTAGDGKKPRSGERPSARIVAQNVRSGQQLYARDTDLVIMGTVSPGAEVMADGCIHIYGALRGRALAGCRGDADARIYCQKMHAELVAIAGNYRVAEDIGTDHRGQAATIFMDAEERLQIDALEAA